MGSQLPLKRSSSTVAFAFDIDGVLVNGKNPIPGARETLQCLQKNGIPFIFLTNSGGVTEKVNLEKLGLRLGNISFDEAQIIQSHTPFRYLVDEYKDKHVLVIGGHGDNIRQVAKEYGFRNILTPSDLVVRDEHIHPFPEMTQSHHVQYGTHSDCGHTPKISAIMVWSSPRDWCLDLQVILDLLLSSKGFINSRSEKNGNSAYDNNGYLQDDQPKLHFCNPDFEWSTKHQHPRLAQGAFRVALCGLWDHVTKGTAKLHYDICGKPTSVQYQHGERALQNFIATDPNADATNIKTVYMIGDNPESDIVGANAYKSQHGYNWRSVLVETGVYRVGTKPSHAPDHIAEDVKAAVEWALSDADHGFNESD